MLRRGAVAGFGNCVRYTSDNEDEGRSMLLLRDSHVGLFLNRVCMGYFREVSMSFPVDTGTIRVFWFEVGFL